MRYSAFSGFALSFTFGTLALGCGSYPDVREHVNDDGGWPGAVSGPASVGGGVRVFSGIAALLDNDEACTADPNAKGDRWCGFLALSSNGERNLFVLNVSQVAAGVPVDCNAGDPNCLLLTSDVMGSGADWHPTFFAGDTLVYYDETITPRVWRPGLTSGRVLVEPTPDTDTVFCTPAARGTAIACLRLPDVQADDSVLIADLYAGVSDGATEPLLAPIESVIAASTADQGGPFRFDFDFPGNGYVAWSSRESPGGLEVLKLLRAADPAGPITIAKDVHAWDISPDGKWWRWLSAIDGKGAGVLQTAPFPGGARPIDLLANTWDYLEGPKGSLVALTHTGDVISIADPIHSPEKQIAVDRAVQKIVKVSAQGHIAYGKHLVGTRLIDLFVTKPDGTPICTLDTSVSVAKNSVHFSASGEAAIWARSSTERNDGFHTLLSDCSTVSLGTDIVAIGWIGPNTATFMDDFDDNTGSGSIRVRHVKEKGALDPAPATLVAEHVDSYANLGPALLYAVNAGTDQDGIYVRVFTE